MSSLCRVNFIAEENEELADVADLRASLAGLRALLADSGASQPSLLAESSTSPANLAKSAAATPTPPESPSPTAMGTPVVQLPRPAAGLAPETTGPDFAAGMRLDSTAQDLDRKTLRPTLSEFEGILRPAVPATEPEHEEAPANALANLQDQAPADSDNIHLDTKDAPEKTQPLSESANPTMPTPHELLHSAVAATELEHADPPIDALGDMHIQLPSDAEDAHLRTECPPKKTQPLAETAEPTMPTPEELLRPAVATTLPKPASSASFGNGGYSPPTLINEESGQITPDGDEEVEDKKTGKERAPTRVNEMSELKTPGEEEEEDKKTGSARNKNKRDKKAKKAKAKKEAQKLETPDSSPALAWPGQPLPTGRRQPGQIRSTTVRATCHWVVSQRAIAVADFCKFFEKSLLVAVSIDKFVVKAWDLYYLDAMLHHLETIIPKDSRLDPDLGEQMLRDHNKDSQQLWSEMTRMAEMECAKGPVHKCDVEALHWSCLKQDMLKDHPHWHGEMSDETLAYMRQRFLENHVKKYDHLNHRERISETLTKTLGLTSFRVFQVKSGEMLKHLLDLAFKCLLAYRKAVVKSPMCHRELSLDLVELYTAVSDMLEVQQLPLLTEVPSWLVWAAPEECEIGATVAEEWVDFWMDTDKTALLHGWEWDENDEDQDEWTRLAPPAWYVANCH